MSSEMSSVDKALFSWLMDGSPKPMGENLLRAEREANE